MSTCSREVVAAYPISGNRRVLVRGVWQPFLLGSLQLDTDLSKPGKILQAALDATVWARVAGWNEGE